MQMHMWHPRFYFNRVLQLYGLYSIIFNLALPLSYRGSINSNYTAHVPYMPSYPDPSGFACLSKLSGRPFPAVTCPFTRVISNKLRG